MPENPAENPASCSTDYGIVLAKRIVDEKQKTRAHETAAFSREP